jgi:hypothetical protein
MGTHRKYAPRAIRSPLPPACPWLCFLPRLLFFEPLLFPPSLLLKPLLFPPSLLLELLLALALLLLDQPAPLSEHVADAADVRFALLGDVGRQAKIDVGHDHFEH